MNVCWLGINNKPHAVVAVIVGFLYGACFITKAEVETLFQPQYLSSAVVQTQHTTEPVLPTTTSSWRSYCTIKGNTATLE